MAQPYIGEIRIFAGNFAPAGWMFCSGQILAISAYETLFTLIGTTYGGDGQSTFALPDLRGRMPMHFGNGFVLAEIGGTEEVTLTSSQIPSHSHPPLAFNAAGDTYVPGNGVSARSGSGDRQYSSTATGLVALHAATISATGGSQPHTNMSPYLATSFIISLYGIFPSPT